MGKTISTLTDEELLKRSGHAGRNLFGLAVFVAVAGILPAAAVLASIVSTVLAASQPITQRIPSLVLGFVVAILLFVAILSAVGLWMLAIAAKRGNSKAVGVVVAVCSVQLALSAVGFCLWLLRHQVNYVGFVGMLVVLLILSVVDRSRRVLIEIKKRGLWDSRFGEAKPSRHLCIVGGILLVLAYVGAASSNFVPIAAVVRFFEEHDGELQQAKAFASLATTEEAELLAAVKAIRGPNAAEAVKKAMSKAEDVEAKIKAFQSKVPDESPLFAMIGKYRLAMADWKEAVTALAQSPPDQEKAKMLFESGDQQKQEFIKAFGDRYMKPKKKD